MHRPLLAVALACLVPAVALAQQAAPTPVSTASAASAAPATPATQQRHSGFGQLMNELTRAAREQARAERDASAAAKPDGSAPSAHAPATTAIPAAPKLADSNGR